MFGPLSEMAAWFHAKVPGRRNLISSYRPNPPSVWWANWILDLNSSQGCNMDDMSESIWLHLFKKSVIKFSDRVLATVNWEEMKIADIRGQYALWMYFFLDNKPLFVGDSCVSSFSSCGFGHASLEFLHRGRLSVLVHTTKHLLEIV